MSEYDHEPPVLGYATPSKESPSLMARIATKTTEYTIVLFFLLTLTAGAMGMGSSGPVHPFKAFLAAFWILLGMVLIVLFAHDEIGLALSCTLAVAVGSFWISYAFWISAIFRDPENPFCAWRTDGTLFGCLTILSAAAIAFVYRRARCEQKTRENLNIGTPPDRITQ